MERKNAPDPLYLVAGKRIPLSGPRVAIVGSRKAYAHGIESTHELASFFDSKDVTVVSGLAESIDTSDHLSTIN